MLNTHRRSTMHGIDGQPRLRQQIIGSGKGILWQKRHFKHALSFIFPTGLFSNTTVLPSRTFHILSPHVVALGSTVDSYMVSRALDFEGYWRIRPLDNRPNLHWTTIRFFDLRVLSLPKSLLPSQPGRPYNPLISTTTHHGGHRTR